MKALIAGIQAAFPQVSFAVGDTFYWSPEQQIIYYNPKARNTRGRWSLLHETGHALLGHSSYQADIELLQMEMAAWQKAQELAAQFDVVIDEEHIQDCLDTYRDWLYRRSICPTCTTKCLQSGDMAHYRCHNCHTVWKVTPSRFCRPYRSTKGINDIKKPSLVF
jgi:hypothetical protein